MSGDVKFDKLVNEEMAIQAASVNMEGGNMPSCLALFDRFLMCYSIPNQFKAMYRHGSISDCKQKWQDFKFCMAVGKTLNTEEKRREAWIRRRSEWWAARRLNYSAEDVFDAKQYPSDTATKLDFLRKQQQ